MNIATYNQQLRPCLQCKAKSAEIFRNDHSVGVICECGMQFVLEEPKKPLNEIVEWWNDNYGLEEWVDKSAEANYKNTSTITLKKVNILSFVKWSFISSLITGFFIGLIYSFIGYYYSLVPVSLVYLLVYYCIGFTISYGILGLLTGFIGGFIYNALSSTLGGVKFEIETDRTEIKN